jgi:ornithine cyclodeaminase/alanine dehydrogenase-like protein (mu-crystallin family)
MKTPDIILLSRADVAELISLPDCIREVERGFLLLGKGAVPAPGILGLHAPAGGMHIKAAFLGGERSYFAAKVNTNFPENPKTHGLPTVQGVIVLCDGESGALLAMLDSIEITIQRTGAATAVAAKYLARKESRVATICGCGVQGRVQLAALQAVLPIDTVFAYDIDSNAMRRFVGAHAGVQISTVDDLPRALAKSDVVVTCTSAKRYFVRAEDIQDGTFVAAVGADNEHKQEIDPRLFSSSKIVVDSVAQCATIGDLHHAIAAGLASTKSVHADLGQIVAGEKRGRVSADEVTIFDSTGVAIEDVVTAAYVYEEAVRRGMGKVFTFSPSMAP